MHFDEEAVRQHLRTWFWLLENFGGVAALKSGGIILPTYDFFPIRPTGDHAFAEKTFERVKQLMGMENWPCELKQFADTSENHPARSHMDIGEWSTTGPAGLYFPTEDGAVIAYSSAQLAKPGALVATLVHELCHYLLRTARSHPPGGWDNHELHTDTAVGFMGFGIFACNGVFDFQQWTEGNRAGWAWSRQGYLSESEHAYSLAVFCTLSDTDTGTVVPHLKKNVRHYFELAMEDLAERPEDIERLRTTRVLPQSLPPILSIESRENAPVDPAPPPSLILSRSDIEALGPLKPWYAPLWDFYYSLTSVQDGESWSEREFAALAAVQPVLRHALLVIRFSMRFDEQGLQGAIILEDATDTGPTLQMLEMTIAAYRFMEDELRALFLQTLHPGVSQHFEELERAEREETLDEFFSPLDHDETWRGFDFKWNHKLRQMAQYEPQLLTHPPA